jgi:hypothetical protein
VTIAFAVCKKNGVTALFGDIKVALFDFLLGVVNGRPQSDFFDAKEIEARSNRANRERKRLSRKRARAAKREREREELKIDSAIRRSEATHSCKECGKRFTSRKRFLKHICEPVPEVEKLEKQPVVSDAKRTRRAKARLASRLKHRAARSATQATDNTVAENKLAATPR